MLEHMGGDTRAWWTMPRVQQLDVLAFVEVRNTAPRRVQRDARANLAEPGAAQLEQLRARALAARRT